MRTSVRETCRGDGKIYTRIFVGDLPEGHRLTAAASARGGQPLPCGLYETLDSEMAPKNGERVFVLVLPDLQTGAADVALTERGEDGEETSRKSMRIGFERAKWESRLNYRLKGQLCSEIRNYDDVASYQKTSMTFRECIPDGAETIIRCFVRAPYRDDNDVHLSCRTTSLEEIPLDPVFLGDSKAPSDVADDIFLREIQLSLRVAVEPQNLIFTVSDANHPEFDSFWVLDDRRFRDMRENLRFIMMSAQEDPGYDKWFREHRVDLGALAKQTSTFFSYRPVYSIVVPLFKTPLPFFDAMADSVRTQSYGRWELVLVDASPEDEALLERARALADADDRVKLVVLDGNHGISENTNAGIAAATGDFVAFFDHDDLLEPDLLFEYTKALNEHDDIDLLYCDEDKLMPDGVYAQPFFKPDFNIDLLREFNYVCHMLTIRKSLLDELPANMSEFDGAQDHNLTLRAVERARRVWHARHVLYHWRVSETSTAASADSKPYATQAGIRAVREHLDRLGIDAEVTQSRRPFSYRVRYAVAPDHPLVSIIIPTKDHTDVLDTCLKSIVEKSTYDNYEIVLVENNSVERETFEYYNSLGDRYGSRVRVEIWPAEFNFSKLMNFGAQKAKGDYLLLLNNDTEVITPTWIEEMLGICQRPEVGIVGVRLLYRDRTIQHAGVTVGGEAAGHQMLNRPYGQWGYYNYADTVRDVSAVTAACMMTKRSVFERVGGFTEDLAVAFNDIDFCLKVREQDHLVVYTPNVELFHYESLSRGYETSTAKQVRFHKERSYLNYRWAPYYIEGDPYVGAGITRAEPYILHFHL